MALTHFPKYDFAKLKNYFNFVNALKVWYWDKGQAGLTSQGGTSLQKSGKGRKAMLIWVLWEKHMHLCGLYVSK